MKENIKKVFDKIELSTEVQDSILERCIEKRHVKNFRIRYAGQIAAAIVVAFLVFGSGTVYAAVSLYQAHMEKMSEKEITERYEAVQNGTRDADSFSRKLSEDERERLDKLQLAYKAGECFPETELVLVDSADKVRDGDSVYYDFVNCIFYLPERTLTDEQLLQIVDVWEKANYSLAVKNNEADREEKDEADDVQKLKEEMKKHQQEVVMTDEQRILNFVEEMLNTELFCGDKGDFSIDDYECQVSLYGKTSKRYWVVLENEEEKYSIFFTPDSTPEYPVVDSIHFFAEKNGEETTRREEADREVMCAAAGKLPEYLEKYVGMDTSIVRKEIYGGHYLVLTDESGNRYRIELKTSDGTIGELLTYEAGQYNEVDLSGEPFD